MGSIFSSAKTYLILGGIPLALGLLPWYTYWCVLFSIPTVIFDWFLLMFGMLLSIAGLVFAIPAIA